MEMLTQLLPLLQAFALFNKQVTGFGAPVENGLAFVGNRPLGFVLQLAFSLIPHRLFLLWCSRPAERRKQKAATQQVLPTVPS